MGYMVQLDDAGGVPVAELTPVISLSVARSTGTLGEGTITLPGIYPMNFWVKNMRLRIYRTIPGYSPVLLGRGVWFVRGWEYDEETNIWTLYLQDQMFVLKRLLVAYPPETIYGDKTAEEGTDGLADDLIKAYVRENGGSLTTDPDRLPLYFDIDVDEGLGPATEKQAGYQNLLETIKGLADDATEQGTPLFFDLTYHENSGHFFFYTRINYLGLDRTDLGLIFSKVNGTLKDAKILQDFREEVNVVYVGGEGQGAGRLLAIVKNEAAYTSDPFGRCEAFEDARDAVEDNVLEAAGRSALKKGTPKPTMTGTIIDSPLARFGIHYDYGDQVYASAKGILFTAHIDAFSVTAQGQTETIDVKLKGVSS